MDVGPASPGRFSRGLLSRLWVSLAQGLCPSSPSRSRPLRVVKLGPGLVSPREAGPAAPGSLIRSGIENEGGGTALPPPPPKMGTEESYKQQAAYIEIDPLQVRGHMTANSSIPTPGEIRSPSVRVFICAYLSTAAMFAALGRTGQRPASESKTTAAPRQHPPPASRRRAGERWPLVGPRWSRRWERACEGLQGVRLYVVGVSVRAGMCMSGVRATSHCGPRSPLRTQGRVLCNYRGQ